MFSKHLISSATSFIVSALLFASAPTSAVVIDITEENLFSTFFGGFRMFVLFYHPDCGACKTIKRDFEVASKSVIPPYPVLMAVVNCGTFEALCNNQGVAGYPSIMHYGDAGGPGNGTVYRGDKMPWAFEAFVDKTYLDCNILDEYDPGCTPVMRQMIQAARTMSKEEQTELHEHYETQLLNPDLKYGDKRVLRMRMHVLSQLASPFQFLPPGRRVGHHSDMKGKSSLTKQPEEVVEEEEVKAIDE